jgi:hypothetical protein
LQNQSIPPDSPKIPQDPPTNTVAQFALTSPSAQVDNSPPKKPDSVAEVVRYFDARVAVARDAAGLPVPRGTTITAEYRSLILARMRETEGSDADKLESCKRVIDVQIHQAISEGKCNGTKDDQARLRKSKGWTFLKITTLFRNASNYGRWLDRWDPDGDHVLWGGPITSSAKDPSWGMGSGVGSRERMAIAAKEDSPENRRAQALVASGYDDDLFGEHDEAHR